MTRLHQSVVGCYMGDLYLGVLAYVDDITLLAPTADAMRKMLHICHELLNTLLVLMTRN